MSCTNPVSACWQVYDEMQEAGLQPDHITYSTLISAYEKAGEPAEALALLDRLHEAGGAASQDTYVRVLQYLATKQLWNRALEVFLELQVAGQLTDALYKQFCVVISPCLAVQASWPDTHQSLTPLMPSARLEACILCV